MYHQCCLIFHMQCNCDKDKDLCTVYIFVFTSPNWFNVYRSLYNSSDRYIPVILKKESKRVHRHLAFNFFPQDENAGIVLHGIVGNF